MEVRPKNLKNVKIDQKSHFLRNFGFFNRDFSTYLNFSYRQIIYWRDPTDPQIINPLEFFFYDFSVKSRKNALIAPNKVINDNCLIIVVVRLSSDRATRIYMAFLS